MAVKTKDSWSNHAKHKDKEKSYWDYFTDSSDDEEEIEYVDADAIEILRQRYAQGDINTEEYKSRLDILSRE